MEAKIYKRLSSLIGARENCLSSKNTEWFARHETNIEKIISDTSPSGGGIDCGTKIDLDKSTSEKIVLHADYHHMDTYGGYDGWTEHTITVKPSLQFDFELKISGRDRNQIKDHLYETYRMWLEEEIN